MDAVTKPKLEVLANRLYVQFRVNAVRMADQVHVSATIDSYDMIECVNRDDVAILVDEWGIAEWRAIGREDRELFLTAEARALLAPQLDALIGWQPMPSDIDAVMSDA